MLWLDFETWCETDIKCGGYRYTADCTPMLFAYAIDDEPAAVVDFTAGETIPPRVWDRLKDSKEMLCAHNSEFDRNVMRKVYPPAADAIERWVDTLVKARLHSLPGALSSLCDLLGLPVDKAKDKDGRRLVLKFTKPNTRLVNHEAQKVRFTRETDPEDWAHFKEYCRLDVEAMREINKRLPAWSSTKELWKEFWLDQRINDRGMFMDMDLVRAAIAADAEGKERGKAQVNELTDGEVQTPGQRDALLAFVAKTYGITLPDLTKNTLMRRIEDPETPDVLRELLLARLEGSKTSVQKYKAIERGLSDDGRLKGCLVFAGAMRTARWSGTLFQPQNLPRGSLKPAQVEEAISVIKAGLAYEVYGDISPILSSCIRGCLTAPEGRKIVVADYSNIEGRTIAWFAGEQWKIKAFEAFDAGEGEDLYKVAYARPFGMDPKDVTKKERQIGKVMELGLGYQGGVSAFLTFARTYGLDLDDFAAHVRATVSPTDWAAAHDSWGWAKDKGMTAGLKEETWTACNCMKNAWRGSHPAIVSFWTDCHQAARQVAEAIVTGRKLALRVRGLEFSNVGHWLRIKLPSGRYLSYPAVKPDTGIGSFTYMGMNQYKRKWERLETYGGKIVENIVQATARDLLAQAMGRVEEAGYAIVLTVHDELVTEAPDSPEFSVPKLASIMCQHPAWAQGLPLAAAGFEGHRYKKD